MNFFNYEGPFFNTLNRLADLVILNVLWLICCIPIVTAGASTTALMYVTMKMANDEDATIAKNFFKSFRENFRQSTIMWLIMLVIGAILVADYFIMPIMNLSESMYSIMFGLFCLMALVYLMVLVYLFPLQAKLENKIKDTFKNAILLSIRHLPTSILLVAVVIMIPLVMFWMGITIPNLYFIWVVIAYAAIAYGCAFLYNRIFNIYIKKPEQTQEGKETDEYL